jgi:TrmH family RNA methyltransferase
MDIITVILIEPENPGNTGAICRAMKNFDFKNIVLINPKFDIESSELRNRAKWANDLVDKIKIVQKYDLKKLRRQYDYLIATTARIGRDYNVLRSPITPHQLAETIAGLEKKFKRIKIGILIGREGSGLNNEELSICDFSVTIPTSKKYGTMNMSHATTVILYEIFKHNAEETIISHINPITLKEKELLLKMLEDSMNNMHFLDEKKKNTQRTVWKKLIGKSFLSKREAYALMGFLKKIRK